MKLVSFRVYNFRSINDSGSIDISRNTALIGRNESGKSNLLLALYSLKPPEGFKALNRIKDFPRHRRLEECNEETNLVSSIWNLDQNEQAKLSEILPHAKGVSQVEIGRCYGERRWVSFIGIAAREFDESEVDKKVRKIVPAVKAVASKLENGKKEKLEKAADKFRSTMYPKSNRIAWAKEASNNLSALRQELSQADVELSDAQEQHIIDLEKLAESIAGDKDIQAKAEQWLLNKMPVFIYLDEYPELSGHQNILELLQRRQQGKLTDADCNFDKMCKVAGLDPQELQNLLNKKEHETRNQLANRASAVITTEIRRLWKDRPLKVRFNPDAEYLDTFISDPNSIYDVEVNLDERSRGFKWFFSFYITFAADTKGGDAENAILLLDEPGLYLHAKSQTDLLTHFEQDFQNQIIYTTHSPFMVPTHRLNSIRTVSIAEDTGTTVTNAPTGDARTLFPLQAALGYDLAQSLFIGHSNLVVEGVSDYWILSSISNYLIEIGEKSLNSDITITPAGGAQKVSYMVALLISEQLNVLLLLDQEKEAMNTSRELVKSRLIHERNVIFISEAFDDNFSKEADIEDLIGPGIYESLVKESYAKELEGKKLKLNIKIPRVAKQVEEGLKELGIEFHKTRPIRLLLKKMANDPDVIMTKSTINNFKKLFLTINERYENHLHRNRKPFQ